MTPLPTNTCINCGERFRYAHVCPVLTPTDPVVLPVSPPLQTGWLCPACGGGNAPFVQRCPCKGWPKMEVTC